jgi:ABC-type glycerol-3-phosphate transport system substrate-binding protein
MTSEQTQTTRRQLLGTALGGAAAIAGSALAARPAAAGPGPARRPVRAAGQDGPTLVYWSFTPADRFEGRAELFAQWESRTGAKIQVEDVESGDALTQRLTAAYSANEMPDIIDPGAADLLIDYAAQGFLLPVDDVMAQLGADDFFAVAQRFGTYEGQLYGIPLFGFPHVMHYRKDWLEEAGLAVPTTFAEMEAAAAALHGKPAGDTTVSAIGAYLISLQAPIYFQNQVGPNNGYTFDEEGNVVINSQQVREAMEHFKTLSAYFQPGYASQRIAESRSQFLEGTIAIECDSTSMAAALVNADPAVAATVGTALLPWGPSSAMDRGGYNGLAYLSIGSQTEEPDLARDFVAWFNSTEVLVQAFQSYDWGFIPQRRSVIESPDWLATVPEAALPIIQIGAQAAEIATFTGQDHGPNPLAARLRGADLYRNLLLRIAEENEPVDEALAWAEEEINRIVEEG